MNNFLLKSYLRCKRKAWLEFKGDKSYKKWSSQKSIKLITEYQNFNKFTKGELFKGIKACKKGYKGVIGLKINYKFKENMKVEVNPSILIKTHGNSIWGKYKYIPAVSKLGRRTTREHLLDLALSSSALENLQNSNIDYGLVISSYKNQLEAEKIYLNNKLKNKANNVLYELSDILQDNIPEITENRKKCSICDWQNFCDKEAKLNGNLTDIDGIGSKTERALKKIGITNVNELAEFNQLQLNKKLSNLIDKDINQTNKFINQSKSYISGVPINLSSNLNILRKILSKNKGVFIFDIESDPDENHDFLYGFLTIENIHQKIEDNCYEPILNLKNINHQESFEKILAKINSHKNWPILHYGETEKITIIKLAKTYSRSSSEIENLKKRFIDLHEIVRNSWILPIKNYSLKTVANWLDFKWDQKNVNGSKALFWWIQYKITQRYSFLEKILKYNKNDCLATLEIAKWLLQK